MFFLATADAQGRPSCSYKGGDPGFVRVLDEHTLVFPNFDGNGMYLSMGNTCENPNVGLLFVDFEHPSRLRVNGVASLEQAAAVDPPYPAAQFVVKVRVREVFPNCPRYIHRLNAGRAVGLRAPRRGPPSGACLEADGVGLRRAGRRRSGA